MIMVYTATAVPVFPTQILSIAEIVCPGFTVDRSVQGSWDETDAGQTVTINCQKKYVRNGGAERTCDTDGLWDKDPPVCRKLGK